MKKISIYFFIVTINLGLLGVSCNSEKKQDEGQTEEKIESGTETAGEMKSEEGAGQENKTIVKSFEEEKQEFTQKINSKLEIINLKIEELKVQAKKEKGEALKELNKELAELKQEKNELDQKLEKLTKQGKDNWEAFKKELDEDLKEE